PRCPPARPRDDRPAGARSDDPGHLPGETRGRRKTATRQAVLHAAPDLLRRLAGLAPPAEGRGDATRRPVRSARLPRRGALVRRDTDERAAPPGAAGVILLL